MSEVGFVRLRFSIVFWIGDLNYRVSDIPRDTVVDLIAKNQFKKLLDKDQVS